MQLVCTVDIILGSRESGERTGEARIRHCKGKSVTESERLQCQAAVCSSSEHVWRKSLICLRWDDDVVFKNQARGTEDKKPKEFVNDLLRSDFHKRFMVSPCDASDGC
jgi:hypothetical protein